MAIFRIFIEAYPTTYLPLEEVEADSLEAVEEYAKSIVGRTKIEEVAPEAPKKRIRKNHE